ncbi:MAG: GNAT family N-acetyltransferase [Actinomycetota bacterium]|nr:GNAT family N-acetyltransferase [Actinomycetota bacterium]
MPDANDRIAIRRLGEADRGGWLALWRGYLDFYRAEVPDSTTELTFARLRDQDAGMLGLVAVDGEDRPIGLAHLVFHAATWSATSSCYLEDLFVGRARRGGEVARALIDAVYATARDRGSDRVYWHTQQFNAPARSLYDTVATPTSLIVYEHVLAPTDGR